MERRGIERDVDLRADYWLPAKEARTVAAMWNRDYAGFRAMSWDDASLIVGLEEDALREMAAGTTEDDLDPDEFCESLVLALDIGVAGTVAAFGCRRVSPVR